VTTRLQRALDDLGTLPVLAGTARIVRQHADDPEVSTDRLVAVIEQDEGFAANLLRLANSAALATVVRATSIRQAVTMVGRRTLGRLALEAETYRFLERVPGQGRVSRGQMHAHAVAVAGCSAAIAQRTGAAADTAHLAGLLHDLGKLVLPLAFGPDAMAELDAASAPAPGAERERALLGVDHAYAGALLAGRAEAPSAVFTAIAWHHGGMSGEECPSAEAACVQLANAIVDMLGGAPADDRVLHVALRTLGLDVGVLDELAEQAVPSVILTGPPLGSLAERVVELERLAQTDELTGLATRRHWLSTVEGRLLAGRPGALLICDVDRFKDVNDRFGHRAGDLVLTEVARVLARQGMAGRLGGDEFGVWIDADAEHARATADRIVAEATARMLDAGVGEEVAGVSIGIASAFDDGAEVGALLEAADRALYGAKAGGRRRAELASGPFGDVAGHARAA
jgi:diguanylate cyclase (GGDEF)-like protein/putative nucleotidyltransferase with HDIG domain